MRAGSKIILVVIILSGLWWAVMDRLPVQEESKAEPLPLGKTEVASSVPSSAPTTQQLGVKAPEPRAEDTPPPAAPARAEQATAVPQRQGPVEALERQFQSESRDADGRAAEVGAEAAFRAPEIPASLLKSVECRRTVCRAELRWTEEHDVAYVLGLTRAVGSFSLPVGVAGAEEPDAQGVRLVVVYWGRSVSR